MQWVSIYHKLSRNFDLHARRLCLLRLVMYAANVTSHHMVLVSVPCPKVMCVSHHKVLYVSGSSKQHPLSPPYSEATSRLVAEEPSVGDIEGSCSLSDVLKGILGCPSPQNRISGTTHVFGIHAYRL